MCPWYTGARHTKKLQALVAGTHLLQGLVNYYTSSCSELPKSICFKFMMKCNCCVICEATTMRQHSFVSLSPCLSVYKKKEDSEG